MTTLIWILLIYSAIVLISEAVISWSMKTWMSKRQSVQDIMNHPIIPWQFVSFIIAATPGVNLFTVTLLLIARYQYLKHKRRMKRIAANLRNIASRNPQAAKELERLAQMAEDLPDKE